MGCSTYFSLPQVELFSVSLEDGPENEKKRGHKGQAHVKSAPNLHNLRTEVIVLIYKTK